MRAYKEAKKSLKKAITRKKNQVFQELRVDVNLNPYGLGYKIVMDKLNNGDYGWASNEKYNGHEDHEWPKGQKRFHFEVIPP